MQHPLKISFRIAIAVVIVLGWDLAAIVPLSTAIAQGLSNSRGMTLPDEFGQPDGVEASNEVGMIEGAAATDQTIRSHWIVRAESKRLQWSTQVHQTAGDAADSHHRPKVSLQIHREHDCHWDLNDLPIETPLIAEIELPAEVVERYQIRLEQFGHADEQVVLFDSVVDVLGIVESNDSSRHELRIPFWTRTGHVRWTITTWKNEHQDAQDVVVRVLEPVDRPGLKARLPKFRTGNRSIDRLSIDDHPVSTSEQAGRLTPTIVLRFGEVREVLLASADSEPDESDSIKLADRVVELLHFQASSSAIIDVPIEHLDLWFDRFEKAGLGLIPAFEVMPDSPDIDQWTQWIAERSSSNAFAGVALYPATQSGPTMVTARALGSHSSSPSVWVLPRDAFAQPETTKDIDDERQRVWSPTSIAWTTHPIIGLANGFRLRTIRSAPLSLPLPYLAGDQAATEQLLIRRSRETYPPQIAGSFHERAVATAMVKRKANSIVSNGSVRHVAQPRWLRHRSEFHCSTEVSEMVDLGEGIHASWDAESGCGRVANLSPWEAAVVLRTRSVHSEDQDDGQSKFIRLAAYEVQEFVLASGQSQDQARQLICYCKRRITDRERITRHCERLLSDVETVSSWKLKSENRIPNADWSDQDGSGRPTQWSLFDGHGIEISTRSPSDDTNSSARIVDERDARCLQITTFAPRHWPEAPCGCVRSGAFPVPESRQLAIATRIELSDEVAPEEVQWTLYDATSDEPLPFSVRHQFLESEGNGRVIRFTAESDLTTVEDVSKVYLQWQLLGGGTIRLSDLRSCSDFLPDTEVKKLRKQALRALADLQQGRFEAAKQLLIATDWARLRQTIDTKPRKETVVVEPTPVVPSVSAGPVATKPSLAGAIVNKPAEPINEHPEISLAMEPLSPALSHLDFPIDPGVSVVEHSPVVATAEDQPEGLGWIGEFGPSEEIPRVSLLKQKPKTRPIPVSPVETATTPTPKKVATESTDADGVQVETRRNRRTLFDLWRNRYRREPPVPSQRASTEGTHPIDKGS